MPEDPVCGMEVSEDTPYKIKTEDETYYFCSRECEEEFVENTAEYTTDYFEEELLGE